MTLDPQDKIFEHLVGDIPLLHSWDGGKTWKTGGFVEKHLRYLYDTARQNKNGPPRIIETGAGNSTLAFLCAKPASLISVCPDNALFDRIKGECAKRGISTAPLTSVVKFSEDCLPDLAKKARQKGTLVDIALIDGGHGWPTVFVDFCYMYAMTAKDGIILVDDVQLHSIKELAKFMAESPFFKLVRDLGKTLAFQKLTDHERMPDFGSSPYLVRRNREYADANKLFTLGEVEEGESKI